MGCIHPANACHELTFKTPARHLDRFCCGGALQAWRTCALGRIFADKESTRAGCWNATQNHFFHSLFFPFLQVSCGLFLFGQYLI